MKIRSWVSVAALATMGLLGGCRAATVRSYDTCIYDSDCATPSDRCVQVVNNGFTRSLCLSSCNLAAPVCPVDVYGNTGRCVSLDGGVSANCYQECTASSMCAYGTACVTVSGSGSANICLPGGSIGTTVQPYAGCAGGMACQSGTSCTTVKDASTLELCTVTRCLSDNDCPFDRRGGRGLCMSLDGDSFGTCVERCNTTSDCTYGPMGAEVCTTRTAMGVSIPAPVCLPN